MSNHPALLVAQYSAFHTILDLHTVIMHIMKCNTIEGVTPQTLSTAIYVQSNTLWFRK